MSAEPKKWRLSLAARLRRLADHVESTNFSWTKTSDRIEACEWELSRARCDRCGLAWVEPRDRAVFENGSDRQVCKDSRGCARRMKSESKVR